MNCLDAETLAAWFDGGLKGAVLEDVRVHVAGCERCQMLAGAMGRTRAAVPAPAHERAPRRWLAWAIPLTAAATALAVWVAIPEQRNVPVVTPAAATATKQEAEAPAPLAAPAAPAVPAPRVPAAPAAATAPPAGAAPSTASAPPPAAEPPAIRERSVAEVPAPPRETAQAGADVRDQRAARAAPAPLAARPEAGRAAAQSANAVAERVQVARCGPAWSGPMPAAENEITAGSSPGAGMCWVVGRGGAVWRSTDGRTWQRVTFPEITNLSAVTASDDRSASVSSADGRTFTTSNGGMTWVRQ